MVSLGDERLCSQWEEQVVTEILTAEDRELWMKEIFIPTKGPTEISNSEWENWRTQGLYTVLKEVKENTSWTLDFITKCHLLRIVNKWLQNELLSKINFVLSRAS